MNNGIKQSVAAYQIILTSIDLVGNWVMYWQDTLILRRLLINLIKCKGITDYWIVKIDNTGHVLWNKTYGGKGSDYATSVKYSKGQYLVGGYSNSAVSGDKTSPSKGGMDYWTLMLDKRGNLVEQNVWGGNGDDLLVDFEASGNNEFLLGGTSYSSKSGDKAVNTIGNSGNSDYWILKLSPAGAIAQTQTNEAVVTNAQAENIKTQLSFDVNPNPVKDVLHLIYNAGTIQNVSLSVYSNNGKLISQQILAQPSGNIALDLSTQPAGIYYAVMQSGSNSFTKKFVKN